jgi:hypothetical protein
MKKSSLYSKLSGVVIKSEKVPKALVNLIPFAEKWSFTNEAEMQRVLERSTTDEIKAFVQACEKSLSALDKYCFKKRHPIPIPDEIVLFQIMYNNFLEARSQLWLRQQSK